MSPEQKAVVERLRRDADEIIEGWGASNEAARVREYIALIESLATQLAAKEAMLAKALEVTRPLNTLASAVFYVDEGGREMNSSKPDDYTLWGFDRAYITYGDLRAARAFLQEYSR